MMSLPVGLAGAYLEPVADPISDLVARFAKTHGPFTTAACAARVSASPGSMYPPLLSSISPCSEPGSVIAATNRLGTAAPSAARPAGWLSRCRTASPSWRFWANAGQGRTGAV